MRISAKKLAEKIGITKGQLSMFMCRAELNGHIYRDKLNGSLIYDGVTNKDIEYLREFKACKEKKFKKNCLT